MKKVYPLIKKSIPPLNYGTHRNPPRRPSVQLETDRPGLGGDLAFN